MGSDDPDRICSKCLKDIGDARAMKAKEKLYHADSCFVCDACNVDLKSIPVYSKDDILFCEQHYREKFLPKCAHCNDFITESCVRAMGVTWHANHFLCVVCNFSLASGSVGYHEHQGKPHCEKCYADKALPKCRGCDKPITDKALKALDAQWHVTCFVCKECRTTFEGHKSFFTIDDMPICGPCAGIGEEPKD